MRCSAPGGHLGGIWCRPTIGATAASPCGKRRRMRSTFHAMSTTFNVAWGTPSQFGDRAKRAGYGPFGPNEPEVTTTAQRATRSENGGQSKPCSATVIGNATGSTIGIYAYDADWDVTRQTGNVPAQTAWTVADAQHTPRQRHAPSTPTTTTATPTTTTATMQCVPGGSPPLHSCSSRHERSKCGTSRQFPDHHRAYAGDDPVNGSDPSGDATISATDEELLEGLGVSASAIQRSRQWVSEADGLTVYGPIDVLFNYAFGGNCFLGVGTACGKARQVSLQGEISAVANAGFYVDYNENWAGAFPQGGTCGGLVYATSGKTDNGVRGGYPCFVANEVAPYIETGFSTLVSDQTA